RCGALMAQEPLIRILTGMMMPFPFSVLTLQALKQALTKEKLAQMKYYIQEIQTQRELFKQDLKRLPVVKQVWDSEGNFLFIQLKDGKAVLQACQENAILVRHFVGVKDYEDFLRVTVSLPSHNAIFTRALASVTLTELA
ncbi:MAG TPA: aminotransferase class I/II-fold pyridoxal phosphate-dependent enzyme, partial [Candidatus Berkiella sp.]|nr:aminotransferase class I/II-fold pyridoxal phosphate-dependent enzyme [Candidatus Berkiella sp.]